MSTPQIEKAPEVDAENGHRTETIEREEDNERNVDTTGVYEHFWHDTDFYDNDMYGSDDLYAETSEKSDQHSLDAHLAESEEASMQFESDDRSSTPRSVSNYNYAGINVSVSVSQIITFKHYRHNRKKGINLRLRLLTSQRAFKIL